ncbi:FecR family protein [Neptuniibacter halophilus]|uniref:FecR family protein n=1 Tax=Neptuniibacter halophilus TaxID=651666 RepID=UPI0025728223|nr:FecR family protein [Neptuniibacter halophilus]
MLKRFKHPVFITLLIFAFPSLSLADAIGNVVLATGKPLLERGEQQLMLKRNDALYQGDMLITPAGSRVLIRLMDKTTITLAQQSQFQLSRYTYDENSSDVRFKMLKGAFRTLTGAIGKQAQPRFEIETPVATIGVRGTEFIGGFLFSDDLDVTMLSGKGVYVENEQGRVELTQANEGTTVKSGTAPATVKRWGETKLARAKAATELQPESPAGIEQ